jgi:hypothetical protein
MAAMIRCALCAEQDMLWANCAALLLKIQQQCLGAFGFVMRQRLLRVNDTIRKGISATTKRCLGLEYQTLHGFLMIKGFTPAHIDMSCNHDYVK